MKSIIYPIRTVDNAVHGAGAPQFLAIPSKITKAHGPEFGCGNADLQPHRCGLEQSYMPVRLLWMREPEALCYFAKKNRGIAAAVVLLP